MCRRSAKRLRGSDVVQFLEFIYPNRLRTQSWPGALWVICDDESARHGTISRLSEDRFLPHDDDRHADAIDSWVRGGWLPNRIRLR